MRVAIERLEGARDAIRFGRVRFSSSPDQRVMTFVYDLLSGSVSLSHHENVHPRTPAPTRDEVEAARRALQKMLPPIGADRARRAQAESQHA